MADQFKNRVVKGAFWAAMEKLSLQFVSLFVTMVLARLLTPTDYGTVALLGTFIVIAEVLISSGFNQALVQRKNAGDLEFNSVFYLSVTIASILYMGLFIAAPYIAEFYRMPELCTLFRVQALVILCYAVNGVQNAELNRKLLFHLSFRINLIASAVRILVGVPMAYLGYGAWAIVSCTLASAVANVIARWYFISWRPKLQFSFQALSGLFSFGWKMLVVGLIDQVYRNISTLIIGRYYTRADLAFVSKGKHVPALLMSVISSTILRVSFPALSSIQDDLSRVRNSVRKMIRFATFPIFPLMTICAIASGNIVPFLFGDQWGEAVVYMQLGCFTFAVYPFTTINLQAIAALGRSDIFLKLDLLKKAIGLAAMCISLRYSVLVFVLTTTFVTGPISMFINVWPNRKLLKYSLGQQLYDVLPSGALCIPTAAVAWGVGWGGMRLFASMPGVPQWWAYLITVLLQFVLGMLCYFLVARAFRVGCLVECVSVLRGTLGSRSSNRLVRPILRFLDFCVRGEGNVAR